MKARTKISGHVDRPRDTSTAVPASHLAKDAPAAANDDLQTEKRDTPENPLWVINIAMGAFFIVAALVMMTS